MKVCFMGTADFACPSLQALYDVGYEIVGVFSQPDRPTGRGELVQVTPVKRLAQSLGLEVFQFEKIKSPEGIAALKGLSPDVCVTAAFGQILSQENLDVPRLGTINVHGSLLPAYRGPAPIQWAVIKGETVTGCTTMFTDIGLDTGDILLQDKLMIDPDETAGELFVRMAELGAKTLVKTLDALEKGTLTRTPQDEKLASYYPMLNKQTGEIDWNASAADIKNLVRGTNPWPGAYTFCDGEMLKIYSVELSDRELSLDIGQAFGDKTGLYVMSGNGLLMVTGIQKPGGRVMDGATFLRGHRINNK